MTDLEEYLSFVESFRKRIEQIAEKKEKYRQESFWRNLSPYDFEKEIGNWYLLKGYDVSVTQQARDHGVDIVLTKNDELTYVQCKHYKTRVGAPACQQLGGAMLRDKVRNGVIVALEGVTKQAKDDCCKSNIDIVTLRTLIRSNKEMHNKYRKAVEKQTIPFRSNLSTQFKESEVYGYYVVGNVYKDFDEVSKEILNIPPSSLTNLHDSKAIIRHNDFFFIIYSSKEKIMWLGDYVLRYVDAQLRMLIAPRTLK